MRDTDNSYRIRNGSLYHFRPDKMQSNTIHHLWQAFVLFVQQVTFWTEFELPCLDCCHYMDRCNHGAWVNAGEMLSPNELSFTPIEYLIFVLCFRHQAKWDFLMNKPRGRKKIKKRSDWEKRRRETERSMCSYWRVKHLLRAYACLQLCVFLFLYARRRDEQKDSECFKRQQGKTVSFVWRTERGEDRRDWNQAQ